MLYEVITICRNDFNVSLTNGKIDFSSKTFMAEITKYSEFELAKAIMKVLEGISPVFAREAAFFATKGTDVTVENMTDNIKDRLVFYFKEVSKAVRENANKFTVIKDKDGVLKDFCFTDINQYGVITSYSIHYTKLYDTN